MTTFSPLLRQAVISIEDKNFESHWGANVFRVAAHQPLDRILTVLPGVAPMGEDVLNLICLRRSKIFGFVMPEALVRSRLILKLIQSPP